MSYWWHPWANLHIYKFLPATSSQHGVPGPGFTLMPGTNNKNQSTEEKNNCFQDTRYQAIKNSDPWEKGNKLSESYDLSNILERLARPLHRERKLRKRLVNSLSWEGTENLGRKRQLEFVGHTTTVEKTALKEDPGDLPRVLLEYSLSSTNQHMCVRKLRPRREPSKRIRRNGF